MQSVEAPHSQLPQSQPTPPDALVRTELERQGAFWARAKELRVTGIAFFEAVVRTMSDQLSFVPGQKVDDDLVTKLVIRTLIESKFPMGTRSGQEFLKKLLSTESPLLLQQPGVRQASLATDVYTERQVFEYLRSRDFQLIWMAVVAAQIDY